MRVPLREISTIERASDRRHHRFQSRATFTRRANRRENRGWFGTNVKGRVSRWSRRRYGRSSRDAFLMQNARPFGVKCIPRRCKHAHWQTRAEFPGESLRRIEGNWLAPTTLYISVSTARRAANPTEPYLRLTSGVSSAAPTLLR